MGNLRLLISVESHMIGCSRVVHNNSSSACMCARYTIHKGDVSDGSPVLVRMHSLNVLEDLLGDVPDRGMQLRSAMSEIGDQGRGVIVLIREPRPTALSDLVERRLGVQEAGPAQLRDYGTGAHILLDLGVKEMILLSNTMPRTIIGLEGFGLSVSEIRPIPLYVGDING